MNRIYLPLWLGVSVLTLSAAGCVRMGPIEPDPSFVSLSDSDKSVVRMAVEELGNSEHPAAARELIELYRDGETHDWWGYHIKVQALISLRELRAREALALCYAELYHVNPTVCENAIKTLVSVAKEDDRSEAVRNLLMAGKANKDAGRRHTFIWGLGRLKAQDALPYIRYVYSGSDGLGESNLDYPIATALTEIGSEQCLPTLMEIYLASTPIAELTCLDGEPVVPCLRGLSAISGESFGDDREAWKHWYEDRLLSVR